MAKQAAVDLSPDTLPSRADPPTETILDLVHLARQTFGDHALEMELLTLFERQAAQLSGRLAEQRLAGDAGAGADLAHLLKGSARSVGAFAVAAAAEAYEMALRKGDAGEAALCDRLLVEIARVRAAIRELL